MKFLNLVLASFLSLIGLHAYSQIPTDVPKPQNNYPVDFSDPANIVIFIVLPILAVVFVIIWRKKKQKAKTGQK